MKSILIFGASELADVAYFYFSHDSHYKVVAFVLDREYIQEDVHLGLPVIPFDEITVRFPPNKYQMFVAMSYASINKKRAQKCKEAKAKGYKLVTYISSKATTWPDLVVGENCFILEDNTIQPFVTIGDNVTLWSGNHIGHHVEIADNNFISSHVVLSGGVKIEENCFIGVNATLRDHIIVRRGTIIGAGTLILRDTQENAVYKGIATEPSKITSDRIRAI